MKRSPPKRSRTSVLTIVRALQQTAVFCSLKLVVIAALGFAFLLLVERLGTAQPTLTPPQLVRKHLTIIKRNSQAPSRQLRVWRCLFF
jgi:hypothetical protein